MNNESSPLPNEQYTSAFELTLQQETDLLDRWALEEPWLSNLPDPSNSPSFVQQPFLNDASTSENTYQGAQFPHIDQSSQAADPPYDAQQYPWFTGPVDMYSLPQYSLFADPTPDPEQTQSSFLPPIGTFASTAPRPPEHLHLLDEENPDSFVNGDVYAASGFNPEENLDWTYPENPLLEDHSSEPSLVETQPQINNKEILNLSPRSAKLARSRAYRKRPEVQKRDKKDQHERYLKRKSAKKAAAVAAAATANDVTASIQGSIPDSDLLKKADKHARVLKSNKRRRRPRRKLRESTVEYQERVSQFRQRQNQEKLIRQTNESQIDNLPIQRLQLGEQAQETHYTLSNNLPMQQLQFGEQGQLMTQDYRGFGLAPPGYILQSRQQEMDRQTEDMHLNHNLGMLNLAPVQARSLQPLQRYLEPPPPLELLDTNGNLDLTRAITDDELEAVNGLLNLAHPQNDPEPEWPGFRVADLNHIELNDPWGLPILEPFDREELYPFTDLSFMGGSPVHTVKIRNMVPDGPPPTQEQSRDWRKKHRSERTRQLRERDPEWTKATAKSQHRNYLRRVAATKAKDDKDDDEDQGSDDDGTVEDIDEDANEDANDDNDEDTDEEIEENADNEVNNVPHNGDQTL